MKDLDRSHFVTHTQNIHHEYEVIITKNINKNILDKKVGSHEIDNKDIMENWGQQNIYSCQVHTRPYKPKISSNFQITNTHFPS